MSEEKPTFKVTDRRLFNSDGTPREDVVREEEPAATPAPEAASAGAAAPAAATQAEGVAALDDEAAPPRVDAGATPGRAPEAGAAGAAPDEDPQEFLLVVEFVASFAADALGMVEHPGGVGREVNLPLARQCIDMLATLQRKTRGNLSAEEQHFLDLILSQLRMQYVSLAGGRGGGPVGGAGGRGFTGGDITGGR